MNKPACPWVKRRWEHPTQARYYEAWIHVDLLGDIVLSKIWGRQYSRLGGSSHTAYATYEEALHQLEALHRRRLQHGYKLVESIGDGPATS